ncbi:MAG: DUF4865 family protein [Actinomycetales bacterium]|nr:DUF4865 family protein [Actinomycetales bacterium]
MQLMQYEITLPADYDMQVIHDRVAARGARTDDFPGLALKAYLVRERGLAGSPFNQYAPFYVWAELHGMNEFIFGAGFDGIRTDFGRPAIHSWQGIAVCPGPDSHLPPITASRAVAWIDPGVSLVDLTARVVDETRRAADRPGVHLVAAGIDAYTWQRVIVTLWAGPVPDDAVGDRYSVLHLSQPGLCSGAAADAQALPRKPAHRLTRAQRRRS